MFYILWVTYIDIYIHKYVDDVPNLSKKEFNHLTNCDTCLKANLTKSSAGHKSLCDSITTPYQGLYIDFGFPGQICKEKDGNIIKSTHQNIEGLNGEQAYILISDGKTQMMHGDICLSKSSSLKYLESSLTEYAPECTNKWVDLDQGGKVYNNPAVKNISANLVMRSYLQVLMLPSRMVQLNAPIAQSLEV